MRTVHFRFTPTSLGWLVAIPLTILTTVAATTLDAEPLAPTRPATAVAVPSAVIVPPVEAVPAPKFVAPPAPAPVPPAPKLARGGSADAFEAEKLLAELGYWTGPVDGVWDPASRGACMAFQKVEGLKRTGRLAADDLKALRSAVRPTPLETGPAHVEVDIARQVLFFVDDAGVVSRVLPVSTGNNKPFSHKGVKDRAYTPRGRCSVYRKITGVRVAPLGTIYDPNYLVGGIAIHGSPSIPATPASHGCVRIPLWASKKVGELTPVGTPVIVHEGGSLENDAAWLKQATRMPPENSEGLLAQR